MKYSQSVVIVGVCKITLGSFDSIITVEYVYELATFIMMLTKGKLSFHLIDRIV